MNSIVAFPAVSFIKFLDGNDRTANGIDIVEAGRRGLLTVNVQPKGYWSSDTMQLRIERKINWNSDADIAVWEVSMGHSSGGRETKDAEWGVIDDMEAETFYGNALIALAGFGKQLLAHTDKLEAAYQVKKEEDRIRHEAEKAEKAAKTAADAPLGETRAEALVAKALAEMTTYGDLAWIRTFERGGDQEVIFEAVKRSNVIWSRNGIISKKELAEKLATMSCRATIKLNVRNPL